MYVQRYLKHFPAAGEIVLFDRSWYNRAGIEFVQHGKSLTVCPEFDTDYAPWYIVHSDNKRRARLNCIAHLLRQFPYEPVPRLGVRMPERSKKNAYDDVGAMERRRWIPEKY